MNRHLIYLIGEPGSGKTTLMRAATAEYPRIEFAKPIAHEMLFNPAGLAVAIELGKNRPPFSGTDTLGMSAITAAEHLIRTTYVPVILAEGARLANNRFLTNAHQYNYQIHLILITSQHAPQRRQQRGTTQNPAWIKGATTRANNLHQNNRNPKFTYTTINTDNTDTPTTPTQQLQTLIRKAVEAGEAL